MIKWSVEAVNVGNLVVCELCPVSLPLMSMCAYVNACLLRYFLGGIIFYAFYLCQSVFHPLFQYAFERPFKISFGARYIFFTWILAANCTFRECEDVYIAVGFIYLPKALLDGGKVSSKNILLVLKQHVCIKTDLILMEKRGRGKKKRLSLPKWSV